MPSGVAKKVLEVAAASASPLAYKMPCTHDKKHSHPLGGRVEHSWVSIPAAPQLGTPGAQTAAEARGGDHTEHLGYSESMLFTQLVFLFRIISGDSCLRNALHKQQSLPLRPIIPLVARISDQNASGAPPMTVREKTRLEKFRQLLSSHNTDLGESP